MKYVRKLSVFLLLICMLVSTVSCGALPGGREETLDIDYVGENGEITEEEVASGDGDLIDWLKNKLSGDKKNAGREDVQSQLNALMEADAQKTDSDTSGGSDSNPADRVEKHKKEVEESGDSGQEIPKGDTDGTVDIPLEDKKKDESDEGEVKPETPVNKNTVTFTIRCDTAVNNGMHKEAKWAGIVPASGVILPVITMEFEEGETVFDLLCRIRDTYKLHMEYSGAAGGQYIEGINNLYEFDGGRWSGWMYCVNGWYPNYGCGQYKVSAGDVIEWNYTCDLGCDLENGDPYGYGQAWKDTHD